MSSKCLGVVGALLADDAIGGSDAQRCLDELLQQALGVLTGAQLVDLIGVTLQEGICPMANAGQALIEVDGAGQGLEGRAEVGRALPSSAGGLAAPHKEVLAEVYLQRQGP